MLVNKEKEKNILSLIPFFRPYKKQVILSILSLLITAFMILFFGKVIRYFIDFGFVGRDKFSLNISFFLFIFAVIIMAIAGYYRSYLINSAAENVIADLRKKVYKHITSVSAEFFEINKVGDVISRLTVDTTIIYSTISSTISFLLRNLLLFFGGICFLFLTSVKLTTISIFLILTSISPIFFIGKSLKKLSTKNQEAIALISGHIEESLNGIKTIQSYLCEEKEVKKFYQFINDGLSISLEKIRVKAFMVAVVIASSFGGVAVLLWIGGNDVINHKITSGQLSSFIFYSIISATSLVALSQIFGQLQSASSACSRVFKILSISSPVKEVENPLLFPSTKDIKIDFENVNFSYPSRKDHHILDNFNLQIKSGEKVAIVGSSGSGKSTILQLLLRFYDINSGSIKLNDIEISKISLSDLRKNFSYISQDCFIFSGTIFENIAYNNDSITKEDVLELISKNHSLSFIKNFSYGIDTFVGEKGIKLSGGERQRISIARAMLKNSPILLFDEATSALDNQNEQITNDFISSVSYDKTLITIAHKLSSIINSNRILFIKDGKVVESGSHEELMKKDGFYKKMYQVELYKLDN